MSLLGDASVSEMALVTPRPDRGFGKFLAEPTSDGNESFFWEISDPFARDHGYMGHDVRMSHSADQGSARERRVPIFFLI